LNFYDLIIAARNDNTIRDVEQSVAIGDKHFEIVKKFVYLGSLMTQMNDVSLEIQNEEPRLQTGTVEPTFTPDKIHHSQAIARI
jgi:hypothetical protein